MKTSKTALATLITTIILAMACTGVYAEEQSEGNELATIQSFLKLMDNYLKVADKYVAMVSAEETTLYLVTEKVVEIYEAKGEKLKAVPELRKILAKYGHNPTVRNLVHFKIADIYKETGQATKALEELNAIIEADRRP